MVIAAVPTVNIIETKRSTKPSVGRAGGSTGLQTP